MHSEIGLVVYKLKWYSSTSIISLALLVLHLKLVYNWPKFFGAISLLPFLLPPLLQLLRAVGVTSEVGLLLTKVFQSHLSASLSASPSASTSPCCWRYIRSWSTNDQSFSEPSLCFSFCFSLCINFSVLLYFCNTRSHMVWATIHHFLCGYLKA